MDPRNCSRNALRGVLLALITVCASAQDVPPEPEPGSAPPVRQDPAQQPTATTRLPQPVAPSANDQTAAPTPPEEKRVRLPSDRSAEIYLAEINRALRRQIAFCEIGEKRSSSSDLRADLVELRRWAETAQTSVGTMAQTLEVSLRSSGFAARELQRLDALSGRAFEREWQRLLRREIERTTELLEEASDEESDATLRGWATEQLSAFNHATARVLERFAHDQP